MSEKEIPVITPAVYPAHILPMPDSKGVIYTGQNTGSSRYALYLSLPHESARLFKECELPSGGDCSIMQMQESFLVAIVVLQAECLQARIVIPVCDEKSRVWLEQCVTRSSIDYFIAAQGTTKYRRFESKMFFPDTERVMADLRRPWQASAQEMLLSIANRLQELSRLESAPSYVPGAVVEQADVCVIGDFFSTQECEQAVEALKHHRLT